MRKSFFLLAVACLFAAKTYGQGGVSFGLKAGINSNNMKTTSAATTVSSKITPMGGIWLRAKVLSFFIQPEVVYISKATEAQLTTLGGIQKYDISAGYISVPVLFGKKFLDIVRINVGPEYQYLLSAKSESKDAKTYFKSSVIGVQAGIGVDIKKFGIDVRYGTSLGKTSTATPIPTPNYYVPAIKNTSFLQVTLAYKLFGVLAD